MQHPFGSFAVSLEALKRYRRTPYFQIKRNKVKIPHSSGFLGAYNAKNDQKMVSHGTPPPWMVSDFVHLSPRWHGADPAMSQDPQNLSPMFRIDVSAEAPGNAANPNRPEDTLMVATLVALTRQMIQHQEKQNQLLEQLLSATNQMQKQRQTELQQWKEANPHLAKACRKAADTLSRVQTQFLESMTEEIAENQEELLDGEFVLQEFVDKYGPRLAHLNGLLQVVAQLGG
jgi:hypothetical protein